MAMSLPERKVRVLLNGTRGTSAGSISPPSRQVSTTTLSGPVEATTVSVQRTADLDLQEAS